MLVDVIDILVLSPDDWRIWRELRLAALEEAPYAFGSRLEDWQGENDREDRWRERLTLPGSYNVVATIEAKPVGMASGVPTEGGPVSVISMWVGPSARGRGVGDALLEAIQRWAQLSGARSLRLNVAEGNPSARALYERNGFRFTGEVLEPEADSAGREFVMSKELNPVSKPTA